MSEYKIFNEVEFDIDNYEEVKIDTESIKSRVKSKLNSRKKSNKKVLVAGLSGLVVVGGLLVFSQPVYASMHKAIYDIKNALGIESNIDNYKTVVGKSITKNDLTITLNEVVIDGDELTLYTKYEYEKGIENGGVLGNRAIYINGELKQAGGGGSSTKIDKNTEEEVMTYNIGSELKGDLDVKIVYSNPIYTENNKEKTINGKWVFEFKTNGDELAINTKTIKLNQSFKLGKDETITLKEYKTNDLGTKIIYDRDIHNDKFVGYDLKLIGKDDLGNDVEFSLRSTDENQGRFKLNNLDENLDKNATKLKLVPYAAKQDDKSGKMNSDFKQIGDEFTIDLNELK
ncbi:hypothetical protein DUF4179 [[Clostridium] sordellii]|uniref:DUF4179 domain-containing protein n=1 Tax=Paraclostridium sordellii TaxID=1505 RepID=UPI000541C6E0|nr:DUF4179 domain-containing protein [Paeniclostridium sordellii]CEK35194.1 hypothetical protein DUF4179 [[Clostridium] sordellii] [Paeniclostridium sordellii]CEQ08997.1 hypothetical protein DUF4179 [[Clostridium] sordellii] [Paeniclostridium sordellii]